jgi:hypothetical protein
VRRVLILLALLAVLAPVSAAGAAPPRAALPHIQDLG